MSPSVDELAILYPRREQQRHLCQKQKKNARYGDSSSATLIIEFYFQQNMSCEKVNFQFKTGNVRSKAQIIKIF